MDYVEEVTERGLVIFKRGYEFLSEPGNLSEVCSLGSKKKLNVGYKKPTETSPFAKHHLLVTRCMEDVSEDSLKERFYSLCELAKKSKELERAYFVEPLGLIQEVDSFDLVVPYIRGNNFSEMDYSKMSNAMKIYLQKILAEAACESFRNNIYDFSLFMEDIMYTLELPNKIIFTDTYYVNFVGPKDGMLKHISEFVFSCLYQGPPGGRIVEKKEMQQFISQCLNHTLAKEDWEEVKRLSDYDIK